MKSKTDAPNTPLGPWLRGIFRHHPDEETAMGMLIQRFPSLQGLYRFDPRHQASCDVNLYPQYRRKDGYYKLCNCGVIPWEPGREI